MYISKKALVVICFMTFVGMLFGLILASNFDLPMTSRASHPEANEIAIGNEEAKLAVNADLAATGKAFVAVAKKITPAVISITSEKVVDTRSSVPDLFHNWWGQDRERRQEGLGSGVIISKDGYIVTNNHVIRGADEVSVLMDNERRPARIIGSDPSTDLAIIKIEPQGQKLPVIALGNSDELEVGEWVLAVGNPFSLRLQHTITAGIVSGKGRANVGLGDIEYEDFIQTDAAINPGNSGGALVNLRGELVGINTAIYAGSFTGGNVGIGFAIPVNQVDYVARELIQNGRVVRGWLGVTIQPVDSKIAQGLGLTEVRGALVNDLTNGPATAAGIKSGDVILAIAGTDVKDHNHLMHLVATHKPGENVAVRIWRNGKESEVMVRLGERKVSQEIALADEPKEKDLGFRVENMSADLARRFGYKERKGVVVVDVDGGSQAEYEGISVGDIVVSVNKVPVESVREFDEAIAKTQSQGVILLHMSRHNNKYFAALQLGG